MQVTTEDGGRLNAFAKEPRMEPRMEVMAKETSRSNASRVLIVSGSLLVVALMGLTMAIS